jgi:superfamily II DNA or RNA helicase
VQLDHLPDNHGVLQPTGKSLQREALHALLSTRGGILQLACGKGKTVIFLDYAARLKVPTLIVIDNTQLLEQWKKEINRHLVVPGGVGLIQADVFDWKKAVVLTTYQTLALRADTLPEEVRRWFGLVAWDEGHHVGAPTFSKTADLFYGHRFALTATPDRDDGQHVIYKFHIGPVVYKDLRQDLKPSIYFYWTGLGLDKENPPTRLATEDKNNELHIGKLAGFLGRWPQRLDLILKLVRDARKEDRKVLVLSNSIDELANLFALWQGQPLFTDIVAPTETDVGETIPPLELDKNKEKKLIRELHTFREVLRVQQHLTKRQNLIDRIYGIEYALKQYACWKKINGILEKEQKAYIKQLVAAPSDAGLMIYQVDREIRSTLIKTKNVVFAVSKYGREGLDSPELDTIIACEPMSSRNSLQQFMGRVQRKKEGKNRSVVVFLEDDIGPMIGMCTTLRRHLREWPADESGPYDYENIGHPTSFRKKGSAWVQTSMDFGR